MQFISFDGGMGVEHIGVGFVKISELFAMQGALFSATEPFDRHS